MGIRLVRVRDGKQFTFGLFLAFFLVWLTFLGYPPDLFFVASFFAGMFLILSNITEGKQGIISIAVGIAILLSVYIISKAQHIPLLSKSVVFDIALALAFFVRGIIYLKDKDYLRDEGL